jgi:hypothetical protein
MYFGLMLIDEHFGMPLRFTLKEIEDLERLKPLDDLWVLGQLNGPDTLHNERYQVSTFQFHTYLG